MAFRPWFRVFTPEDRETVQFRGNSGVRNIPRNVASPKDYFFLFFSVNLLREITRQTNRYARQFIAAHINLRRCSRVWKWVPVSLTEMRVFLAIIINMGVIKKPTISEYWNSRNNTQSTPWFRDIMSRNRFQLILKFFHVTDNKKLPGRNSPHYRPNMKFQSFLDFANRMFQYYYRPTQNLSVDETLVETRGRTSMLQYIPTKRAKFGVKFWVLAESATGYIMRMNCYLGRALQPVRDGLQGSTVVLDLLAQCHLLDRSYHIFVDSFFCSLDLARRLLQRSTYLTGTLRSNRPMPNLIKTANPAPDQSLYIRQGDVLVIAYKGQGRRQPVRMLSTGITARDENGIPALITGYNRNMGSVDESDMLMSFYNVGRKSLKVWKKMVFHIIFRMVLNAFVLYTNNTNDNPPISRLRFIQLLVSQLAGEQGRRRGLPPAVNPVRQRTRRLDKIPGIKQRDCCVCSNRRQGRGRSSYECSVCRRGCHKACWPHHACHEE